MKIKVKKKSLYVTMGKKCLEIELGWFKGENPSLFEMTLFEYSAQFSTLLFLKVLKFCLVVAVTNDYR